MGMARALRAGDTIAATFHPETSPNSNPETGGEPGEGLQICTAARVMSRWAVTHPNMSFVPPADMTRVTAPSDSSPNPSDQPCKWWVTTGRCHKAAECRFRHSVVGSMELAHERRTIVSSQRTKKQANKRKHLDKKSGVGIISGSDGTVQDHCQEGPVGCLGSGSEPGADPHDRDERGQAVLESRVTVREVRSSVEIQDLLAWLHDPKDQGVEFISRESLCSWQANSRMTVLVAMLDCHGSVSGHDSVSGPINVSSSLVSESPVGMILIRADLPEVPYLGALRVHPSHRRRRVGSRLIQVAYERAIALPGAQVVRMGVSCSNTAMLRLVSNLEATFQPNKLSVFAADGSGQEFLSMDAAMQVQKLMKQSATQPTTNLTNLTK
eukprot:TRINITY_DN38236_c0_g1_i1.p1 TRINITY_DN38236_c0_g1~~TRINITY_DN38236_c0_g1_i1.p1  ORF type:complete len:382 (-),score=59.84 TRINITY_DN38236_c0_g1_i1:112-1257(-)